jgi:pimeloyl-ACP methyl ester carboxylesterase
MSLSTIAAGIAIDIVKDIAKDEIVKLGKKAVDFKDSGSGKKLGTIISYREGEKNNNLLLFVHGFSGSSSETFGVTPDILVADADFNGWDVFSIGYSSDIFPSIGKGLWSVNPDITKIAAYLNTLLNIQFNGKKYDRVAFVGHSMGGLAIQRAILDAEPAIQQKLSHVIFFGTPSGGLRKAFWARFWNTQLRDLSDESDFIKKLRKDWNNKYSNETPFAFKTIAGTKDEFVPVKSSLSPFPESCRGIIEGNHISMIKPKDINDLTQQSFTLILKTLTDKKVEDLKGDSEEINILLGKYQTVINNFLPNVDKLAINPLINLVFALECSGRKAEALQILQNHKLTANNSDILGIIGGRYKRAYLLSGFQQDLDMSIKYYSDALNLAKNNNDAGQIFYNAINLAFLKIAGEGNKNDMKMYAQLALDNCKTDSTDKWELATIAEANLYLGNTDIAEQYYKKAAEHANARDKSSMYSNAFNGYKKLTNDTSEDAAFIKMLDDIFLK